MTKLKILINASIIDPKPTGLGRYAINVIEKLINLSNNFFEYYIITSVPDLFNIDSNYILEIPKLTQPIYGKKAAFLRALYLERISCSFNKAALIYSPTHHGLLRSSIKQIITIHDLLPIKFKSIYSKESVAYFYYKIILPKLIKKTEKLIVPSKHTKFDILESFELVPEKISVIYNGIDNDFKLQHSEKLHKNDLLKKYGITRWYILSVGTTSFPYKNTERLIKAFSKIFDKLNCELVFCGGRTKYIQKLERLVSALGIKDRVKFLNYLNESELYHLYKFSSIFIYPSLYEGFGLPPLEAMACGTPVVVSNVASLPEVCGDAAYYVDPYNIDSIAEGIYKVLTDKNLRENLIQKGFKRAKLFSWEKTAIEILKVFEEVLRKS